MAVRMGKPLPAVIANAPELQEGLRFWYNAFLDLSADRPVGMGEGPIPWTSIERYAERWDLDEDESDDLHHHIRSMDKTYLKYRAAKTSSQVESPPTSRRGKKG